jgi:hypothetical protein
VPALALGISARGSEVGALRPRLHASSLAPVRFGYPSFLYHHPHAATPEVVKQQIREYVLFASGARFTSVDPSSSEVLDPSIGEERANTVACPPDCPRDFFRT